MNNIISDSLTRIRNVGVRELETTKLLYSRAVEALVGIFQTKGYIESFNVIEEDREKFINVVSEYGEKSKSVINELKRVSKSGYCIYKGREEVKRSKNGYGTIVISTSRDVLANNETYKTDVDGGTLCTIW